MNGRWWRCSHAVGGELCSLQQTNGEIKPPKDRFTFQQRWRCPGFSCSGMRAASPRVPAAIPHPGHGSGRSIAAKSFSSHLLALHPARKTLSEPECCIKQRFCRSLTMQILTAGEPESERRLGLDDLGLGIQQNGSRQQSSGRKLGARWVLRRCGGGFPREGISIAQLVRIHTSPPRFPSCRPLNLL